MINFNNEQKQWFVTLACVLAVLLGATYYAKSGTRHGYLDDVKNETLEIVPTKSPKQKKSVMVPQQPSCPPQDKLMELTVLCEKFVFRRLNCIPQDITNPNKHKIPHYYAHSKNSSDPLDPMNLIGSFIAVCLITSMGASFMEFVREKRKEQIEVEKKDGKINRKCSLADLTVLKHHRKELLRRESILEQASEDDPQFPGAAEGPDVAVHHRRCSFPTSLPSTPDMIRRKISVVERRMSAINVRKQSLIADDVSLRRGSASAEDFFAPDRRHHTRLVHRH